jgi:hypothetical protein
MPFSLPFFKKKASTDVYFGLLVKQYGATGFVIEKQGGEMKILAQESVEFTNGWDTILEQVDEVLFSLEQKTGTHLEHVIYFVYSHFVDHATKDLKKEYLGTFKSIAKHLELKPLGYIECYEAVLNHLAKRDGNPVTGILLEMDKTEMTGFVYKSGLQIATKTLTRTEETTVDVEALLHQLGKNSMLPARIVLYDAEDARTESSQLVSHRWDSEIFVQIPRIELLKSSELYDSLVSLFEGQIAGEVEGDSEVIPSSSEPEPDEEVEDGAAAMGFAIGKEVPHTKEPEPTRAFESETIGTQSAFATTLDKVKSFMPSFSLTKGLPRKSFMFWGAGLALVLLLLFLGEYFFHRATIDVLFPSQTLDKSTVLSANLDGSGGDFTLSSSTISQDYSEKKATTGKRDEGEKAKGEVTLHNFDDKDRVVSKGTTLEAQGVKFVLDDDVKVASASLATDGSAKLPGKAKGKITAAAIGTEGNIAKGERFKIGDLSSTIYFGINESALSGGTKKQVRTVAKQDVDALKEKILAKAEKDVTEKLKNESNNESQIIESLTESVLSKNQLSKEVSEEASEVTLKTTAETTYYTYKLHDIRAFLKNSYTGEIPAGYKLDEDKITFDVKSIKKDKTKVTMTIEAKGLALKDVSQPDIVSKIAGKKQSKVDEILKEDFQATGSEIHMRSPLFLYNFWVPFFKKNIQIKVSSL